MDVTILDTSAQLVHCEVQDKNSTFTCWMTFGYGLNTSTEKMHLWDHWRQLGRGCHNPWVVLGYFNAILSHEDKLNGDPVMPQDLTDFQQCVDDIGVGPLPSKAHRYTWCNKRDGQERIYSHIDWALGNPSRFMKYNHIEANFKEFRCYDNTPIMLCTDQTILQVKRLFILLNVVMQRDNFEEMTRSIWQQYVRGLRCSIYGRSY
ncbi:hypothetical protein FXO38_27532 [Capsicum annuum]|uniref:Uncharacterized protein n=1 Tax=Capsicum annuum TaxID=4072 RepID=A0A2G2Z2Y5_CAPAN|nr:hypothetical protein FXO38_27532 [Capsicum annuum]PHT76358.1 hypothetical protein T459_19880 [Capsicum annuum]